MQDIFTQDIELNVSAERGSRDEIPNLKSICRVSFEPKIMVKSLIKNYIKTKK